MVDFRSGFHSYGGDRKIEIVNGKDFSAKQTYIMSQSFTPDPSLPVQQPPVSKSKKKKKKSLKPWSFNDPEMKRRKRVAKYKIYAVEGKVKASFRKGICWIKNKCSVIVHGL